MSSLLWGQSVCKGYDQTTQVDNEFTWNVIFYRYLLIKAYISFMNEHISPSTDSLALCRLMEFSIKSERVVSGWSNLYTCIVGLHKYILYLNRFCFSNEEMPHFTASNLSLCL